MKAKSNSVKKNSRINSTLPDCEKVESDLATSAPAIPGEQQIAEAAYFRAEQRGFVPGNELDDWLDAEAEVTRKR
jgi:hypothetical protein